MATALQPGALTPSQTQQTGSKKAVSLIDSLLTTPSLPQGTSITPQVQNVQTNELLTACFTFLIALTLAFCDGNSTSKYFLDVTSIISPFNLSDASSSAMNCSPAPSKTFTNGLIAIIPPQFLV